MTYIKTYFGFDSSVEGWTGDNVVWEAGGNGGLPTGHIKGSKSMTLLASYYTYNFIITFKSPNNLTINQGDFIAFVLTWSYTTGATLSAHYLNSVTVKVIDSSGNVAWSTTVGSLKPPANTPSVCVVKAGASGVQIEIDVTISLRTGYLYGGYNATCVARIDSVTIYAQPDQIIHTPIPATVQATLTFDIPINKSGSYVVGAIRMDDVQNTVVYNETLTYDTSNTLDYGKGVKQAVTTTSSVDKVSIKINPDATLQVYYECDHAVWMLDPNTYYPVWLCIIKCYHNQNPTNPDTVSFSTVLYNSTYTDSQTMSFKFTANGIFNCVITPERDIIGDTTGVTSFTVTITVKDANGNVIGTCNYDVLNDSYDQAITIPNSYDNQDLTIEFDVSASGTASVTITTYLKLKFDFTV